ncbi:uncharacterized protein EV154DRAFT_557970 [Mucor mucedo]|uniref:uncharacterized protein n=1 Tax=Mucor mucedo TaxID=29922 RepID=UPI0022207CF0|nr:uncharacterized protein EV154DRAFT_557970 [Mucor mucedo]KAI7896750.1 hypothetical protein EV154DRAFT_557970 [Mucor mucedo]
MLLHPSNHAITIYDGRFTDLRFSNYRGQQRMDNELVNIFCSGATAYTTVSVTTSGPSTETQNQKWKKAPFKYEKKVPLIALGSTVLNVTMKGKQSGMLHRLRKKMEEASADERLILVYTDEYLT